MSEAMLAAAKTKLDSMVNDQDHFPRSTKGSFFNLPAFESGGAIPVQISTDHLIASQNYHLVNEVVQVYEANPIHIILELSI